MPSAAAAETVPVSAPSAVAPRGAAPSPAPKRSGSQKRRRSRKIAVCVDDAEFGVIDGKARTAGLSLASYGRAVMLGSPGPRARRSPPVNAEALAHATVALNRANGVMNQVARVLNAGRAAGSRESLAAIAEIHAAATKIREVIGRPEPE
jgi:hypothetical protein